VETCKEGRPDEGRIGEKYNGTEQRRQEKIKRNTRQKRRENIPKQKREVRREQNGTGERTEHRIFGTAQRRE
jgi:hypothetical protein